MSRTGMSSTYAARWDRGIALLSDLVRCVSPTLSAHVSTLLRAPAAPHHSFPPPPLLSSPAPPARCHSPGAPLGPRVAVPASFAASMRCVAQLVSLLVRYFNRYLLVLRWRSPNLFHSAPLPLLFSLILAPGRHRARHLGAWLLSKPPLSLRTAEELRSDERVFFSSALLSLARGVTLCAHGLSLLLLSLRRRSTALIAAVHFCVCIRFRSHCFLYRVCLLLPAQHGFLSPMRQRAAYEHERPMTPFLPRRLGQPALQVHATTQRAHTQRGGRGGRGGGRRR